MSRRQSIENAVELVREMAPRLAKVANLTVISCSFLEGAKRVMVKAQEIQEDAREVVDGYYNDVASITVVRLKLLLDSGRDAVSFQSVYKCLQRPEVVDALVARMGDDPLQPEHIEDDIRHRINEFLRIYRGIDWRLHGRLTHLRNQGLAHLSRGRARKTIKHDELCSLVRLVKDLGDCLEPFAPHVVSIREDEIADRINRAAEMWCAALSFRERRARLTMRIPPGRLF
jgi:hypothetical protein